MAGGRSGQSSMHGDAIAGSALAAAAFERAPVALMRVAGPEHRYVAANAAYRALVGRESLVGRTPREALPGPGGRQQLELLDRVFDSGEGESHRAWRTEVDRPGGGPSTEVYLDLEATPFFDRDGSVGGVDLCLVDVTALVTEERRAHQLAHRARQRNAEARDLVLELQDALLPGDLPILPRLGLAARYLLAADHSASGGDWFDVVVRADGTVVLVVGDVVGHGVAASAAMGQLRAALHQRLLATEPLTEALAGLDRYAGSERHASTLCAVELDPRTGAMAYCTAGHPAPLVLGADGSTRFLTPTGAGPLATRSDFPVRTDTLGVGESLLLYTDGIIERPGTPPARSTMELARVVRDAVPAGETRDASDGAPTRICEQVLDLLVRASGYRDDITLLAAQRLPHRRELHVRQAATPRAAQVVREQLADWLEELPVRPLDELCVQHATGELVANAVEHAYPPDVTGVVRVRADLDDTGHLVVEVRDHGRWPDTPTESPHRGNGLAMVREFVDALTLDRGTHGTTATIRHRLSRPAHLLRAEETSHAPAAETPFQVQEARDQDRLVVSGVVDTSTADSLRHLVLQASRGGTRDLVVDLAGVTHLASAGVQVLSEAAAHHAGLDLEAPMGSVAQHVLETVRIPYRQAGQDPRG